MGNELPSGKRFSHIYLRASEQLNDSSRMRLRLQKVMKAQFDESKLIGRYLEQELGIEVMKYYGGGSWVDWDFISSCELCDVLDSVTLVARFLIDSKKPYKTYTENVARIFDEERTAYRIDDMGGVHPEIDSSYQVN